MIERSGLAIAVLSLIGAGACIPPVGPRTFFRCPDSGAYCTADGRLALEGDAGPTDAGADAGGDAGGDAGFDAGLDGGPVDAGQDAGCVIAGTGTLSDLLYPRWGLAGAYLDFRSATDHPRIFAAGGFDPSGATTADVQGDELNSGSTWAQTGTVPGSNFVPRASFALVAQESIGLIAIGGEDPNTQTVFGDTLILPYGAPPAPTGVLWYTPDGGGPTLIQPRHDHAAVLVNYPTNGGEIITCGGNAQQSSIGSCEILSLAGNVLGEWVKGPSMKSLRQGLSMAVGSDGNVYAFSGFGGSPATNLTSFEMLNPNDLDAGWSCPGACPTMVSGHVDGAAAVVGTKMYVMGGTPSEKIITSVDTVEYLDLANLSAGWQPAASMHQARSAFGAVVLPVQGTIRVFGGLGGTNNTCTVGSVEEYDPSSNMWN